MKPKQYIDRYAFVPRPGPRLRDGFTMLLVLVVVAALSIAVYAFSRAMLTQLEVAKANHAVTAQRQLALSAIEFELNAIQERGLTASTRMHATGTYKLAIGPGQEGEFTVLRSLPRVGQPLAWGMNNESAKLNLNSLAALKLPRAEIILKLIQTPRVTATIAEAIATKLGISQDPQTIAQPKFLLSLDELLTIPGISEEMLYGEDINQNGILDDQEDDGSANPPTDNANGRLERGLSDYWTVTGGESNFRSDGRSKIFLNNRDLVKLYDELLPEFGLEIARFVVAWRSSDAVYRDAPPDSKEDIEKEREREMAATIEDRLRVQLGLSPEQSNGGAEVRAGLLLSRDAGRPLKSILDLAHCQVQVTIDGTDTVLLSPLSSEPSSIAKWLRDWEQRTTLYEGLVAINRININQAPFETLMTVEGMTPEIARSILRTREQASAPEMELSQSRMTQFDTVAWLTTSGITTSWQLRKLAPGITTGGSVASGIALGQLTRGRTAVGIRFTLDARIPPARLQAYQELSPLSFLNRLPQ